MKLLPTISIFTLLAFANHFPICETLRKEITTIKESLVENHNSRLASADQWPQKKHIRRKERRKGRHNHQSSTKRYFEKQLLVRNRTLTLLGAGMEKFFPNAVDLLDINPQELPGESPFQKWHSHGKNHSEENVRVNNVPSPNLPDVLKPTKLLDLDQEKTTSEVKDDQMMEYNYRYETPHLEDTGVLQLNLGRTLKTLLNIFSDSSNNKDEANPCEKWIGCRKQLRQALAGQVPACPCEYPSSIFYEDKVWDGRSGKYFRWKDASGERLDVYKPGAEYCIRSLVSQGSSSLAVQHCCYDRHRRLLTRGSGAGTPNLVSPDISPRLHHTVDILPWVLCKGDFTVYNRVRPPDNGLNCTTNPASHEFNRQVLLAKYY